MDIAGIELRQCFKGEWLDALRNMDIANTLSPNIFALLQNFMRKVLKESDYKASHSLAIKRPPLVTEASGLTIKNSKSIVKYLGKKNKVYIFRAVNLEENNFTRMMDFSDGVEQGGGSYSFGGILQMPKRLANKWFGWKVKIKNKWGMFCSEYTSRLIHKGKIFYILNKLAHEITPSLQLHWFLTTGIPSKEWTLVGYYDRGDYYLPA